MKEYTIHTQGRRGCIAAIEVSIYEHSIVVTAENDKLTPAMMHKALRREFPNHTFYTNNRGGASDRGYLRADADRWTNDGL